MKKRCRSCGDSPYGTSRLAVYLMRQPIAHTLADESFTGPDVDRESDWIKVWPVVCSQAGLGVLRAGRGSKK